MKKLDKTKEHWHAFKTHLVGWHKWILALVMAMVLLPSGAMLFVYLQMSFSNHAFEMQDGVGSTRTVKRYSFKKNEKQQEDINAYLEDGRLPRGKMDATPLTIDSYYEAMRQNYTIANIQEGENTAGELGETNFSAANVEVWNQSALPVNSNDNPSSNITSIQPTLEPIVVGKNNDEIIGNVRQFKVIERFANATGSYEKSTNYQKSKMDNLVRDLDKKGNIDLEELYINQKYVRRSSNFNLPNVLPHKFPHQKFFTSPAPDNSVSNEQANLAALEIILSKSAFYSYELVDINLKANQSINIEDLKIYVVRDNYVFPNVGGNYDVQFRYKHNTIYTSYALGYAPSPGKYQVVVKSRSHTNWSGLSKSFYIIRRIPSPLPSGFSIVNLEYTIPLNNVSIRTPNGEKARYPAIVDWIKHMDADALWMLVAQTTSWSANINKKNPWIRGGFTNLNLLGKITKQRGIAMGAYIMSYYTPGNGKKKVGYEPSLGYNSATDRLQDSLHISLKSQDRLDDIVAIVKQFKNNPYVDYVGLDFIRTGRADGYEMGPLVVDDMNIKTPAYYDNLSYVKKVKWFARQIEVKKNNVIIQKWRWWRAHKVATIVNRVVHLAKLDKPLWVFTLGWEHGKQHGQDPYMFFDAGATADAVMLYEANRQQFQNMMVQWPNYMRDNRNNVIIGNAVDVRFLDGKYNNVAKEYVRRTQEGYQKIYRNGFAKGIFMHDISRALWSSRRGIDMSEWAVVHGHATSIYRHDIGDIPYRATAKFHSKHAGIITIINTSNGPINNLRLQYVSTAKWKSININAPSAISMNPKETKTFAFTAKPKSPYTNRNIILGYELLHHQYRKFFFFTHRDSRRAAVVDSKTKINYSVAN